MMEKKIIVSVIVSILFLTGCIEANQPKHSPGGPYYYKSWENYYIPFRPIEEISFEEAMQLEKDGFAYYEAYFNDDGHIIVFRKHFEGKLEFEDKYYYENDGRIRREQINSNGEKISGIINKNGEYKSIILNPSPK